jgi:hypothetical protein
MRKFEIKRINSRWFEVIAIHFEIIKGLQTPVYAVACLTRNINRGFQRCQEELNIIFGKD